ncbi:MAG: sulfur oxidation c-type cytochrome SoxA [Gammaproteobacteria bacterium]|nr:sulfur oxidation c-type cytochrome SoxA [Gammaproteobacteria bacterium]
MKTSGLLVCWIMLYSMQIMAQPPVPTSGYDFLGKDIQAIQDDEFLNPGMPTVELGSQIFQESEEGEKSCASCHGEEGQMMDKAKIASYPAYQKKYKKVHTLQERIHACWTDKQDRFPLLYDDPKLVALETFVRSLARGTVIDVEVNQHSRALYEQGEKLYKKRFGQMAMTCHHCHVQYQGIFMRGRKLTQGQTNGFPVYRFNSDRVTSLHRRFNECFVELRAEPFEAGSQEYKALEFYIGVMSNGLKVETPAVRF